MSIQNLTWPQVVLCIALLAATVTAYRLLGEVPAGVLLVVSSLVNFLLGRPSSGDAKGAS